MEKLSTVNSLELVAGEPESELVICSRLILWVDALIKENQEVEERHRQTKKTRSDTIRIWRARSSAVMMEVLGSEIRSASATKLDPYTFLFEYRMKRDTVTTFMRQRGEHGEVGLRFWYQLVRYYIKQVFEKESSRKTVKGLWEEKWSSDRKSVV